MTCYLVRHGQSEWNLARLTQGQTMAPPLTELGRREARTAAAVIAADLEGCLVGEIRSSDLVRAHQSADIIAGAVGGEVVLDPRLREQHLGTLQGRPYEETWAAAEAHDWSDVDLAVAGGESPRALSLRMASALDDVDGSRVTVLVTHGDAIRALLADLAEVPSAQMPWVPVPNGAVVRVDDRRVTWLTT